MKYDVSRITDNFLTSINKMKSVACHYRDFPFYRAPQAFINKLSHGLPVLMLAMFFSPASAGFYSIARTALALPSILIGKSVSDVFYPRFTEADRRDEDRFSILLRANLALAGVGLLPFSVVILFGPWLFAVVFGSEWINAGEYARWLSLWMYFVFINPPNLSAIAVMRMQRFYLIYEIISIVLRVLALLSGYLLLSSDLFSVGAFSIVGAALNIFLILITLYHAGTVARTGASNPTQ
jgi:O-antigen/teichoic acid export membrane protein